MRPPMEGQDMDKKNKEMNEKDHQTDRFGEPMEEPPKEKSFWKRLSKLFCSVAMFNAINKHY